MGERSPHHSTRDVAIRAALLGALARIFRFKTLPLVESLLAPRSKGLVVSRPFAGYRLHLEIERSSTHRMLYVLGERAIRERRLLARLVRPGMHVVDVGANIGYLALLFRRLVGSAGSVTCFEPDPANRSELERNIARNRIDNVEALGFAVGAVDGVAGFSSALNGRVVETSSADVRVEIRRLDTLDLPKIDLLKIDVEGFEIEVLRGAGRALSETRPVLWIEVHPELLGGPVAVAELLEILAPHYSDIVSYFPEEPSRLGAKVAARYLGRGGLHSCTGSAETLEVVKDRGRLEPFWLAAAEHDLVHLRAERSAAPRFPDKMTRRSVSSAARASSGSRSGARRDPGADSTRSEPSSGGNA